MPAVPRRRGPRAASTSAGRRRRLERPRRAGAAEEAGEALRLLYVALTRAQSQVVAWWAPTTNTPASPLHRMLFGPPARDGGGARRVDDRSDDEVARAPRAAGRSRGGPTPRARGRPPTPAPTRPAGAAGARGARASPATVDTAWRRTSYSSLTAVEPRRRRGRRGVGSEPEVRGRRTTRRSAGLDAAVADGEPATRRRATVLSPMAGPAGRARRSARWCTRCSSTPTRDAADLRAELLGHDRRAAGAGGRSSSTATSSPTPWSPSATPRSAPLAGDSRCARSPLRDRLRELDFELPLAGGDRRRDRRGADVRSATWRRCCAATCPTATRSRPTPTRSRAGARRAVAARLPHRARSTWCCGCPGPPLPGRRLQDQLARRLRPASR